MITWAGQCRLIACQNCGGTLAQDHNTISQIDCFINIMRHHHHRRAGGLNPVGQQILHLHFGQGVERSKGFIQQQHLGPPDQRARAKAARCAIPPES